MNHRKYFNMIYLLSLCSEGLCHFCRFCLSLAPVKEQCFDTGIVSALVTLLLSQDQDLLLHVSQAIARICYDSSK